MASAVPQSMPRPSETVFSLPAKIFFIWRWRVKSEGTVDTTFPTCFSTSRSTPVSLTLRWGRKRSKRDEKGGFGMMGEGWCVRV